jgi:hypothetical protein
MKKKDQIALWKTHFGIGYRSVMGQTAESVLRDMRIFHLLTPNFIEVKPSN